MIIESVNIKSFGMITDMSLDFSKDINVIVGQNEAGKSTVAAFIKYMLYGFGNENVGDGPDERQRRINWNNGTAQGSMTVRVGEKRYLITRTSELIERDGKAAYKEDSVITDLETGSPAFGKVPAGEVFFGVERDLFENTAFIGQIGDSSINEGSVKQSIENILFSGNEKTNNIEAAARVCARKNQIRSQSGAGGQLYQLEKRVEQYEREYIEAKATNDKILEKEAKLHVIKSARSESMASLETLSDLDLCYRNVIVIQMFEELHSNEAKYEEKAKELEAFKAANTRADYVPDAEYLTELAVSRRSVDDAYRNLAEAEDAYTVQKTTAGITRETEAQIERADTLGGEKSLIARARSLYKKIAMGITLAGVCALVMIAAIVFQIAITGTLSETVYRILFAIPGAAALVGAAWLVVRALKDFRSLRALCSEFNTENANDLISKLTVIGEERAKRDKLMSDTEHARTASERARERYEEARNELLNAILKWGEEPPTTNLNEFLNNLEERVRAYRTEEERLSLELRDLKTAVDDLRANLQDKNEVEIRAQVSPLKRKVLASISYDEMIEGIADCKAKIAAQDKLAEEVERELDALKFGAPDPCVIYARILETEAQIEELEANYTACEMALRAIENGSDNLRLEISPRLGEYSAALMGVMTDKKYSNIDVSDGLKVSFVTPEGESRSVDFLSGGTRDLTYISLRMALIDMLYSEKPPVCFDESFAHQDNARAHAMMRAIKKLSEEGQQSFIFTCREREATFAKELSKTAAVIKLSGSVEDLL